MEFFKQNTNINFMGQRKWTAFLSVILCTCSIVALAWHGLTWGLDFTGGTQIQVHYVEAADLAQMQADLEEAGFADASVVSFGTSKDVLISLMHKKAST